MLTPGKDVRGFINNNRHTTVEKGAVISTLHNAELTNIQRISNPAPVVAIYSFPDLTGDGRVTQKDILRGRKVPGFKGGGTVKKRVVKRSPKSRGTGAAVRGTKFKGVF